MPGRGSTTGEREVEGLLEGLGPLSVTARVAIALAIAGFAVVVIVTLTSFLIGLRGAILLWIGVIGVLLALLVFLPVDIADLKSRADPAKTFEDALARFDRLDADPPQPVSPLCAPGLLHHGEQTPKAVVLMHGVSSCPRAFVDFAPLLHEAGYNVLTVRMPENGYADRATDALKDITAEALAAFADESVDIATGLG